MKGIGRRRYAVRRPRRRRAVLALAGMALGVGALVAASGALGSGSSGGLGDQPFLDDPSGQLGDLPVNPQWLANTVSRAATNDKVKNNTIPGAIERRNKAIADWNAAQSSYKKAR